MLNHDKIPGAGSVADTVEFMKQMWSSMGAPSMAVPSLSVEDINKKISDLKTVASWLELNLSMLKATIQTLEVQSATLSTLQAMSAIMASRQTGEPETPAQEEPSAGGASFPFGFPLWPGAAGRPEEVSQPEPEAAEETAPAQEMAGDHADEPVPEPAAQPQAATGFQSAIANPNAWWNLLQDQFTHAVGNAMTGIRTEEEPVLKPAKAAAVEPQPVKRSENKTVPRKGGTVRSSASKARPASASRASGAAGKTAKAAPKKPPVVKAPKRAENTSAPARTAVVQSRQNKKPASRKPTSP